MSHFQIGCLVSFLALLVIVALYIVLPPTMWAVAVLIAAAYGLIWLVERALRRVWRR